MTTSDTIEGKRGVPPFLATLVVVAAAVGIALGAVLWWTARHDRARQDAAQRESASRLAQVARLLLSERIERGRAVLRAIASSGEVRQSLMDGNQPGLLKALGTFSADFGSLMVIVTGADDRLMAWSSPLAIVTLGDETGANPGAAGEPVWGIVGGDLALIVDEPVELHGRALGWIRGAIFAGRFFVTQTTDDLGGIPIAIVFKGDVAHHTFPATPVLPELGDASVDDVAYGQCDDGETGLYDVAVRALDVGGQTIGVAAGVSRTGAQAAGRRYAVLLALVGGGALLATLSVVGAHLFFSQQRARLILQRDSARRRSAGLSDRLAHLTAVVHDIKAPVSGIQLRTEGLIESSAEPATRSALTRIVDTCERLNLYLVNVLTAARAEDGTLALSRKAVLLPGLVEEAAERFQPQAERRRVALGTSCESSLPAIDADAVLLSRALENLAANALDVSEPGTRVTLFARRENGGFAIGVADEGPGFRSFEPEDAFTHDQRA
ncbi:MAG: hypothetical protein HC882_06975 [Acidobacteria bacterium]|nr:hypothetical protein [Acidobacteriota bacterium]